MTAAALRVGVGLPSGPRSSVWRIWFGPGDVYVAFRNLGAIRKTSIHFPRPRQSTTLRYVGFTKRYAENLAGAPMPMLRRQRTHLEWMGTPVNGSDFHVEFRMRVAESELRVFSQRDDQSAAWLEPPPRGYFGELSIISGPSNQVPNLVAEDGSKIGWILEHQLLAGPRIWVLWHHYPGPTI